MDATQEQWSNPFKLRLRGYHPLRPAHSSASSTSPSRTLKTRTYYTTSSPLLLGGIQFILCRVRSTLLTASRLFSFPLPTKMFQFGRFPLHIGSISKRRKWEVPLGNPGFKGCMLLAQAISLLAATLFGDSSQAIPQMV